MIEAGAELTRKLEEDGLPISAALWSFMPESNEWRLLFASSDVGSKGPREVYETIRLAISQLGPNAALVPLSTVSVLDDGADLVKVLRRLVRTGPGIARIRVSRNVINGHFIDDALVYRIN
jgi:hypothetical protein